MIVEDRQLPELSKAVNQDLMAGLFQNYFDNEYPEQNVHVDSCEVGRVYHKPGRYCNITYRIRGHRGHHINFDQWFFAKMLSVDKDASRKLKRSPDSWPGCGPWKPVGFWPDMNMLLQAFPYDPKLPQLHLLTDDRLVREYLDKRLPKLGFDDEWRSTEITCQKVKYRAGKSCVLRFAARLSDGGSQENELTFYSKTYRDSQSKYVYDVLDKLCSALKTDNGTLAIPRPVAHLDEANTLWQESWEGDKLSVMMRRAGWETFPRSGLLPRIAVMLATLQRTEVTGMSLRPSATVTWLFSHAQEHATKILQFLPERKREVLAAIEALASYLVALKRQEEAPLTFIHGTFKLAQILVRGEQLALIDFDAAALGDPMYDVAEFLASLIYPSVSDGAAVEPLAKSAEMFWDHYTERVPWACDSKRVAWYVVAFLLGKINSSLKSSEVRAASNMDLAFGLVGEWSRKLETSLSNSAHRKDDAI